MSDLPSRSDLLEVVRAECTRHFNTLAERLTESLPLDPPPDTDELRAEEDIKVWLAASAALYRTVKDLDARSLFLVDTDVKVPAKLIHDACTTLNTAIGFYRGAVRDLHKSRQRERDASSLNAVVSAENDRLRSHLPDPPISDRTEALADALDRADARCPRRLVGRLRWARNLATAAIEHLADNASLDGGDPA